MARSYPHGLLWLRAGDEDGVPGSDAGLNVPLERLKGARESRDQRMPPGRLHRPALELWERFRMTFPS